MDVGHLIKDLWVTGNDGLKLLKSLNGLDKKIHFFVDKCKVVQSLDTVGFDTDGLEILLFGSQEFVSHE